jgi:hypothetical protein
MIVDALHELSTINPNRELSLVKTKLQEALMWLERENKINFKDSAP